MNNKKDKPCKDHFMIFHDAAELALPCEKCGFKVHPISNWMRPVKFENKHYFDYEH